ncbi:MAG TPA: hypothetical protein VGN32_04545 [Ktedonobacterales bacterium]|jgi:hypothetical protein|nr:hypothetical protein [Ktedonobacterales bacterium]
MALQGTAASTTTRAAGGDVTMDGGFDWVATLLAAWLIGGIFLDGWAHNHIPSLETIFTPWHAVLYSGYAANGIFLAAMLVARHKPGQSWLVALPEGYFISFVGAAIFFVGGVLDLTGHYLFGIEKSIEGLLSPTHLMLALGATLIVTGPLRAAVARAQAVPSFMGLLPAVLSLTAVLALLMFFTQYSQPIVNSLADKQTPEGLRGLGIYAVLLQTVFFMGVALYALRRWRLPFGTFAVIVGLSDALANTQARPVMFVPVLIVGAVTGLLIDLAYLWLRPTLARRAALYTFAFLAPVITFAIYFAVLADVNGGLAWSGYLVAGSIVQAGLVGLLLSLLIAPPISRAAADA